MLVRPGREVGHPVGPPFGDPERPPGVSVGDEEALSLLSDLEFVEAEAPVNSRREIRVVNQELEHGRVSREAHPTISPESGVSQNFLGHFAIVGLIGAKERNFSRFLGESPRG